MLRAELTEKDAAIEKLKALLIKAEQALALRGEPVAWMFQHDETGRFAFCANDGINTPETFLRSNTRYGPPIALAAVAAVSGERERSPAQQMPATVTSGAGIAEVDSSILDRIESATSVKNTPVACSVVAGVSGERVREALLEIDRVCRAHQNGAERNLRTIREMVRNALPLTAQGEGERVREACAKECDNIAGIAKMLGDETAQESAEACAIQIRALPLTAIKGDTNE